MYLKNVKVLISFVKQFTSTKVNNAIFNTIVKIYTKGDSTVKNFKDQLQEESPEKMTNFLRNSIYSDLSDVVLSSEDSQLIIKRVTVWLKAMDIS